MFGRRRNCNKNHARRETPVPIEHMEPRRLLSSAAISFQPDIKVLSYATSLSDVQGYSPSQTRQAYGFSQIRFSNGAVAAEGQGQTIAIVDAYNDPTIVNDLAVFDKQFSLAAPPSFKVVNQSGGAKLPATQTGWAGEISLDVQWAHAIAPQANILLVEASSDSLTDLLAAVKYARSAAGVSVVSMSWGGSEFFSWSGSGEFPSQTSYDPIFTTPAGHTGVTFIASAGDSGSQAGVQWPSSSPNVLSIGGTTLNTLDQTGTYGTESAWTGTSGGYSQIEKEPAYQTSAQGTGTRSTPDVAYDGDPNTGFAVYDSTNDQGYVGWEEVGGTSAGAPQWAGLIAITNQGRALAGKAALDGTTQTLPLLYGVYSAPNTANYSTYTADFNDVTSGGGGRYHRRWGGFGGSGGSAAAGYDTATGLGSPKAMDVVDVLGAATSASSSPGSDPGSTLPPVSNPTPAPATLATSPVSGIFVSTPPAEAIGSQAGWLKIRLSNVSGSKFVGTVTITLDASTDTTASSGDTPLTATPIVEPVTLKIGGSKTFKLRFTYPTGIPDGSYYLIATLDTGLTDTSTTTALANGPITLKAPTVDLSATFNGTEPIAVAPGKNETIVLTIENLGNVTAFGTLGLNLYASDNLTIDSSDEQLPTTAGKTIKLRPGRSMKIRVHFTAPTDKTGGTYSLLALITSSTQPADTNAADDLVTISTVAR